MAYTIRVSLPSYDALTDTNLDHYALCADIDNILIKEKARGTITLSYSDWGNIAHNLNYIPAFLFWGEDSNGNLVLTESIFTFSLNSWYTQIDGTNLLIAQGAVYPGTATGSYFIFYDNIT